MANNTLNPIPSSDPRDFFDNATTIDLIINSGADRVPGRFGQMLYTWGYFHRLVERAVVQIDGVIVSATNQVNARRDSGIAEINQSVAAVNAAEADAKTDMLEMAAELGNDLNNKRYTSYSAMLADPQNRDAVVGIVDGDPDESLNGWYSWDLASAAWRKFIDQPITDSGLAQVIKDDYVSEEKAVFTASDEDGYTGFLVARERLVTRGLDINSTGVVTAKYAENSVTRTVTVMDEFGYASVHIGADEMKAVLDAKDAAAQLAKPRVAYAPISKSANKLVAHRGRHYADIAPENSLDGYRLAAQAGFRYVETDIQRTADGNYVLCHDAAINRTFMNKDGSDISGAVNVGATTLAVLRANYVFKSSNPRYQVQIPTLEDLLQTCVEYNLYPWIELKDTTFVDADFVAVNNLCVRYLGNEFWYLAGGPSRLAAMRALNPNVMLGYVFDSLSESNYAYALNNKPACIDVNYLNLTAEWVARARKDGIPIAVYTVPASAYSDVSKMGSDYIAGDELAPEMDRQQILFSDVANGDYSAYKTSGLITSGLVTLASGRNLTLLWDQVVPSGGAYLAVEYTGALTVSAGSSTKTLTSTTRKSFRTQVQLFKQSPGINLRGGTGGCTIHEISVAIAKF
ncbi:hypothetical protein IRZ81_10745 [Pseudomonas putida]|uniref:glycerophosphodiester phosphodiesterase n=1 Tax=Pseudomonas putida TaxID=303 RepID=UPI0018AC2253|nr:glycerophosphodiester phosphodiesterase family protein [Pseudomonas putida]MBF8651280.1 hypothetical protein [Pseudomonas putida]MBF8654976.1 hypothetical protein [Pseudomonas putida]